MPQIIEDEPNFGQRLAQSGRNFGKDLPQFFGEQILQAQQRKRQLAGERKISDLIGEDVSGVNPELQKIIVAEKLKGQNQQSQQKSNKPDVGPAVSALNTLERMIEEPGIGLLGRLNPSGTARKNRGIFESTQAAILPLFKGMFPRGMTEKEFRFIQDHYIPQASDTEEKIRGKIQGLRQLVQDEELDMSSMQNSEQIRPETQKRPPLSSFSR